MRSAEKPYDTSKYRDLNLLMLGASMVTDIPAQVRQVKESLAALKSTKDPKTVAGIIANLQSQASGLTQKVRAAFQKR